MPRLVRRAPLSERIKASLDPSDLLLWLAEELNDERYDEWLNEWATAIGIALNIVFILARGASRSGRGAARDDVFGDAGEGGSGWFAWFAVFLVHLLTLLCCLNALYTFLRKRDYRLFERPLDDQPATPSARRVPVDHSPIALSPLRYLHKLASPSSAARVHGDAARQVWELRVWNPKPFHLTLFTLFSPGHLLLYYTLLPPAPMDPRPSVTMLTAIAFSLLLSVQLGLLRTSFAQQAKDSTLVHGEVMHEYDTKFVRPSLNRPVRDVATQTPPTTATPHASHVRPVDLYTPTTIINRGFRTHPNPTYAPRAEPASPSRRTSGIPARPAAVVAVVPTFAPRPPATAAVTELSSPLKPHHERLRERSPAKGDGGSMGVYTHAASPLRRAASSGRLAARPEGGVAGRAGAGLGRERERERPGRY